NLGEPALDLLVAAQRDAQATDLYVLELSSYQLESTLSLDLKAAAVLNVTPDHMDRYATVGDYAEAKARIFARCDTAVINLDDPLVVAMPRPGQRTLGFSLRASLGAARAPAALALGEALGLPLDAMLSELESFPGLPHRSQWVADINGVTYI